MQYGNIMSMRQFDLKKFRKANGISQKELAAYLGIGQSFVSQMENQGKGVPEATLEKILSNPEWSYTVEEASLEIGGDSIQQNGGTNNIGKVTGDAEVLALRKEVEILREMVTELRQEKEAYWEMIQRLTGK